jgi:hypothetical protein
VLVLDTHQGSGEWARQAAASPTVPPWCSQAKGARRLLMMALCSAPADITAKAYTQWLVSSLAGLGIGFGLCFGIKKSWPIALGCFVLLTILSLISAYM